MSVKHSEIKQEPCVCGILPVKGYILLNREKEVYGQISYEMGVQDVG